MRKYGVQIAYVHLMFLRPLRQRPVAKRGGLAQFSPMRILLSCFLIFWVQAAAAQVCEGRYDAQRNLIDQTYERYGTLYAGGPNYESLGGTIELYRLLMGLPDAGLAAPPDRGAVLLDPGGNLFGDMAFVAKTLRRSLARISDPDFRRDTPQGSTDSEVLLNLLTVIGPYPGWWLTPDAPHLSEIERVIASFADDDALDWLLTVQAASARPHTISWTSQRMNDGRAPGMYGLLVHALERYQDTQSLPWLLAVMLVQEDQRFVWRLPADLQAVRDEVIARVDDMTAAVEGCVAHGAEYAAFAIARFEQERYDHSRWSAPTDGAFDTLLLLPASLRQQAAVQLAKTEIARQHYDSQSFWRRFSPDDLRKLADDPRFDQWLNTGLSFRAGSVDALIEITAGVELSYRNLRLMNVLSAEDLLRFARSRGDFEAEQRGLTTVAFLRFVALGQDARAKTLVPEIVALWPERQVLLDEVWGRDGTLGYRLVMVALALPEPRLAVSTVDDLPFTYEGHAFWTIARRTRDLPVSVRTGAFLTSEFREWMGRVGLQPWSGYDAERRAYRRGQTLPDVLTGGFQPLPESTSLYNSAHLGLVGFAAWDELGRMGPQTGLANRIGQELILNARAKAPRYLPGFLVDREPLAQELELVIWQGRRMIHGEMNGRPLGQVAYNLLHGRLGDTEAAGRVPYWYVCQDRCEP